MIDDGLAAHSAELNTIAAHISLGLGGEIFRRFTALYVCLVVIPASNVEVYDDVFGFS